MSRQSSIYFSLKENRSTYNYIRKLNFSQDVLQEVYLTSTISQWLTAFSMVLYIVTFYRDFARIELNQPTVTVRDGQVVMKVRERTDKFLRGIKSFPRRFIIRWAIIRNHSCCSSNGGLLTSLIVWLSVYL